MTCVSNQISRLLTVGSTLVQHSVFNVKVVVITFNQQKAFSVFTNLSVNSCLKLYFSRVTVAVAGEQLSRQSCL